ncbi:MAG: hypothetical protein K2O58_04670 [Bacteroidales bacterium]|nr:hypothetical protein [Bacteroidales bacterium]
MKRLLRIKICLMALLAVCGAFAYGQEAPRRITGKVTGIGGEPLVGAGVVSVDG